MADANRRRRGAARALHWLLVNLSLTAALLVAAEGVMALAGIHFPGLRHGDRSQDLWVSDRTKGWFHRPGFRTALPLGGPDAGTVRTNALGLRGPEVALRKPPGVRRLLAVGDSYVFGHGVDDDHAFPRLLEARLNAGGGATWEVLNLGVNSYSTDQQLILFGELAPQLAPDVVVLVVCDNDFGANTQDFVNQRYYKPYFVLSADGELVRHNVPVPALTRWQSVKLWLGQRSNVWNAIRSRRSQLAWVDRALDAFQVATPMPPRNAEVPLTAALVLAIRDLAAALGSEFATLNTGHRGENTELFHELRRLLRPEGVRFLGLEGHLGEARRRHPDRHWDFPGDAHWNVAAHELVARVTYHLLEAEGLLSGTPAAARRGTP